MIFFAIISNITDFLYHKKRYLLNMHEFFSAENLSCQRLGDHSQILTIQGFDFVWAGVVVFAPLGCNILGEPLTTNQAYFLSLSTSTYCPNPRYHKTNLQPTTKKHHNSGLEKISKSHTMLPKKSQKHVFSRNQSKICPKMKSEIGFEGVYQTLR